MFFLLWDPPKQSATPDRASQARLRPVFCSIAPQHPNKAVTDDSADPFQSIRMGLRSRRSGRTRIHTLLWRGTPAVTANRL